MIRVEIESSAQKDLDKLDKAITAKILDKLTQFEQHPKSHQWLKKLEGYSNLYRLHVGTDWVVAGQIEGDVFRVRWISHRSEIYKRLRRQ